MANIFPTFSVPDTIVSNETVTEKYRPSIAFEVETGEFVVDRGGTMRYSSGYEAWVLWCQKTVSTERWAHLAYPSYIGTEMDSAFQEPDRASQESAIERTITEALLADPRSRTVRVYDFSFKWLSEVSTVTFTVLGSNGDSTSITTQLND